MQRAYILIETAWTKAKEVANELREKGETKNVYVVTGPYDLIAEIVALNTQEVTRIALNEILGTPGVSRVVTCQIVET